MYYSTCPKSRVSIFCRSETTKSSRVVVTDMHTGEFLSEIVDVHVLPDSVPVGSLDDAIRFSRIPGFFFRVMLYHGNGGLSFARAKFYSGKDVSRCLLWLRRLLHRSQRSVRGR